MLEHAADEADSDITEYKMPLAQVAESTFVPGTWIVVVLYPEMHRIGDHMTREDAERLAEGYCDRVMALLKRARSLM